MYEIAVPKGWTLSSIEEYYDVFNGKTPSRAEYRELGFRIIKVKDLMENGTISEHDVSFVDADFAGKYSDRAIRNGDTLLLNSAHNKAYVGSKCAMVNGLKMEKVFCVGELTVFRAKAGKADPRFIYYFLRSPEGYRLIQDCTSGIHVYPKDIRRKRLPFPNLGMQSAICDVLQMTEKLTLRRKQANQLTNKIIRSIFLKMFGHGKPQNKIDDVAEFVSSGSTPLGGEKTYVADGIVFIRSQNVLMNELKLDHVAHITEQVHNQMRRTWVKDGDVLLNITGASMGRVAFYRGPDDKANVNQHVCIIRLNKHKALPEYISYYLSSSNSQKQIWTIQAGASRQALNFEQVKSLSLYLPPLSEQQKFATIVRTTQALRGKQTQSAMQIDELFHSLMHKAFRGELVAEVKKLSEKKITSSRTLDSYLDRNVLS